MAYYRTPRIIGRVVKTLFILLIVAVNAVMIWRVFLSDRIPDKIDTMTYNSEIGKVYEEKGNDIILQYQNLSTVTRGEKDAGYFGVPSCVFIPEAQQVQVVFRYNNSTLRHVAEDFDLPAIPDKENTYFDVTLVKTTDLTPDDLTDNNDPTKLTETRFRHSSVVRETTALYTYYRYVYDGVTIEDDTAAVFVDAYYPIDMDYTKDPYGTLCIYYNQLEWLNYRLTSADKKALSGQGD